MAVHSQKSAKMGENGKFFNDFIGTFHSAAAISAAAILAAAISAAISAMISAAISAAISTVILAGSQDSSLLSELTCLYLYCAIMHGNHTWEKNCPSKME
jgi:hypothetical protein